MSHGQPPSPSPAHAAALVRHAIASTEGSPSASPITEHPSGRSPYRILMAPADESHPMDQWIVMSPCGIYYLCRTAEARAAEQIAEALTLTWYFGDILRRTPIVSICPRVPRSDSSVILPRKEPL